MLTSRFSLLSLLSFVLLLKQTSSSLLTNASQNACYKPIIYNIDLFGDGEFVLKGGGVRIPRFKEHLKCRYVNPDADANAWSQGTKGIIPQKHTIAKILLTNSDK